jgi:hypothetical protein
MMLKSFHDMSQFRRKRSSFLMQNHPGGNGLKPPIAPTQATEFLFSDGVETVFKFFLRISGIYW